jgi:predicted nucleotidyltransferase
MAVPAETLAARAADWARADAAVRAAVVYGSLAQGTAGEHSDLDLIIVAEPGQRDALWERRAQISERVHGRPVVWSQEPSWQRPYRYKTWDENLIDLDLTFDEEYAVPWAGLARGFYPLVDKAAVAARLSSDLASWHRPEFDAAAFDGGTWAWLNYLHGRLAKGEAWIVRYGVMDTLNNRIVPLLGAAGHSAHRELRADVLDRVQSAAPASADPAELLRSLRATAELYQWALDRWAERTGLPRPHNPLAPAILARLAGGGSRG